MRIFVHDYCGHPFQIQLSRQFALLGHQVCHSFSTDIESPRGDLIATHPSGLIFAPLGIGTSLPKYDLIRRSWREWRYAQLAADCVRRFKPDVVISGNAPPTIQRALQKVAGRSDSAFVYWVQDIYSVLLEHMLPARLSALSRSAAAGVRRYEFGVMARSDAVVVISEDFVPRCVDAGVPRHKIHVQHNWASLADISPQPRDNAWARGNDLVDKFVFLFSGTLGLKHNPRLLADLATSLKDHRDVVVAIVSQGLGRDWLAREAQVRGLDNLRFFDFQPFARLSEVLASGDVLVAILEAFAGELSVPSKTLSYFCAQRPVLGALPSSNLASRTIQNAKAGIVVSPSDGAGFNAAARLLMENAPLRAGFAAAGRAYAEATFDIDLISEKFLSLFRELGMTHAASLRPDRTPDKDFATQAK